MGKSAKRDVVDQIEKMSYKLSLGELWSLAPSVKKKSMALLKSYEENARPSEQANLCEVSVLQAPFSSAPEAEDLLVNIQQITQEQTAFAPKLPQPQKTTGVLKAMVRISEQYVSAIVDTGASYCMISSTSLVVCRSQSHASRLSDLQVGARIVL